MIDSEIIDFDIFGYGKFTLDDGGLSLVITDALNSVSKTTQDLIDDFNFKHANNNHLTPLEALGKIPKHFYVTEDFIQNVETTNVSSISTPTKDLIF
jgi:hypothetical protein